MFPSKRPRYGYGVYDDFVYSVTPPAAPTSESVASRLALVVDSYTVSIRICVTKSRKLTKSGSGPY